MINDFLPIEAVFPVLYVPAAVCCIYTTHYQSETTPLLGLKQIIFAKNKLLPQKSTEWKLDFNRSIP